ncbi:MAG: lysophospholipid acyltransferase family protein [Pseudomonadota bacterium]
MKLLRIAFRLPLLILHIIFGLTVTLIFYSPWVRPWLPGSLYALPDKITVGWSAALCWIMGVKVRCHGERVQGSALYVSNHISWLDIFSLLGLSHIIFVAKQEVKGWPVLGWLSYRVGTLYIRRGGFEASRLADEAMTECMNEGTSVMIFPEGTSSDGTSVKRFHARLFQAAITAKSVVQPIALCYPTEDGISTVAPFIGDDEFVPHMLRVMGEPSTPIDIYFCEPIDAGDKQRRKLADTAYERVVEKLTEVSQPSETEAGKESLSA